MKKHRIFIAINLPEQVKDKLTGFKYEVPAKWTKKENLHITLKFLGNVWDEYLPDVLEETKKLALKTAPFVVKLDKIDYFPNKERAKYIFVTGGKYHITLARIRSWQFKEIDPEDIPEVEEDIDIEFEVNSIEVMESVLKRGGPEYTILQSYKLNL